MPKRSVIGGCFGARIERPHRFLAELVAPEPFAVNHVSLARLPVDETDDLLGGVERESSVCAAHDCDSLDEDKAPLAWERPAEATAFECSLSPVYERPTVAASFAPQGFRCWRCGIRFGKRSRFAATVAEVVVAPTRHVGRVGAGAFVRFAYWAWHWLSPALLNSAINLEIPARVVGLFVPPVFAPAAVAVPIWVDLVLNPVRAISADSAHIVVIAHCFTVARISA